MGSPISSIVVNLYMEDVEIKVIITAEYPPRIWKRYVDDTCVIIEATKKEGFLEHINSIDPHILFTTEDAKADGSIPFLYTIVMPQPDNSLLTTVYRMPTHTDCMCTGTVTIVCKLRLALLKPSNIEPRQSVATSCY